MFATRTGGPLQARNVIRAFKVALEAAGLPRRFRVHDLRHAAATLMLGAGVHPKVASERLGHSTVGITLDLYTHAVQGLDRHAADRMQQVLRAGASADGRRSAECAALDGLEGLPDEQADEPHVGADA